MVSGSRRALTGLRIRDLCSPRGGASKLACEFCTHSVLARRVRGVGLTVGLQELAPNGQPCVRLYRSVRIVFCVFLKGDACVCSCTCAPSVVAVIDGDVDARLIKKWQLSDLSLFWRVSPCG